METIETGYWTTCLEILPPAERSRGKFHLYRSSLPTGFEPAPGGWGGAAAVARMLRELGVAEQDFAVRPLLKRGYSEDGLEIGAESTVPELTVTAGGLHWHPAGADLASSPDMLLVRGEVPLSVGKQLITGRFFHARLNDGSLPAAYRCAV